MNGMALNYEKIDREMKIGVNDLVTTARPRRICRYKGYDEDQIKLSRSPVIGFIAKRR